jgi:chaperonin GroEL
MSNPKECIFEEAAREKLASGISKLAKAVKPTLGPKGRNVGLERSWGAPQITNDGNSIVKEIELTDQYEEMGAAMAKEAASKMKDISGDGTTTVTILLDALVQKGVQFIASGASPILLKRGIDKSVECLVKELKKMAHEIKSYEETKNIATVAASGHETIGKMIADAIAKVDKHGVVTIEEAKGTESSIEVVEGMQFDRGYMSPYFATNQEKMVTEINGPALLIVDKKITTIQELIPILQAVSVAGKELLIVAEDIEADALATLVINKIRGTLRVTAVKAPGFGDNKKAMLQDLALLTGATLISEEVGLYLKEATLTSLGHADRVIITKDHTTIIGGAGDSSLIKQRVTLLENEAKKSTSSYDKEKLLERKAKLQGGVAVIRVGAASEPELKQKKQMFEDSLSSTKAALAEGVVMGAGVAFLRAARVLEQQSLQDDEALGSIIVKEALFAPCRQIIENTGFESAPLIDSLVKSKDSIGFNALTGKEEDLFVAGVIDPVSTLTCALTLAASIAGIVLLSEVLIGDAKEEKGAA